MPRGDFTSLTENIAKQKRFITIYVIYVTSRDQF